MRESKVFSLPIARKRRNNATPGHRGVAGRGRDVMGGRGDSVYYSFLTSLPSFQESSSWHTPASSNYKAHTVRVGQQQDAPRRRDESIVVSYYAVENCMAPSLIAACLPLKINGQMNKLESHLGCRGALTATVEGRFSFCFLVFCCCCCRASPSLSLDPRGTEGRRAGGIGCECNLFVIPLHSMRRTRRDPARINWIERRWFDKRYSIQRTYVGDPIKIHASTCPEVLWLANAVWESVSTSTGCWLWLIWMSPAANLSLSALTSSNQDKLKGK